MRIALSNWRVWLMLTHRWMGIVIGMMFVAWVVSGIVLLYFGLPHLTAGERLSRLPPLDAAAIKIAPADAARRVDGEPFRMRVSMQGDRPVYRINTGRVFGRWQLVYADTGEPFDGFDAGEALDWLRGNVPEAAGTMAYGGYVTEPELFTHSPALQTHLPLHRIALNDAAGSVHYVSVNTGETVMKTDRATRALGVSGYLLHTLFFFRQEPWWGPLLQVLSWGALLMCVLGVVLGIVRFALTPRFRHRGQLSRSPYTGLMKWHHYAGLIFSVFVLTWAFSGVASLNVVPGIRETLYTPDQIAVGARSVQGEGPRIDFASLSLEALHAAVDAIEASFPVKELELISFAGSPYYLAYREPTEDERLAWRSRSVLDFLTATLDHEHRLVAADDPAGAFERFSDEAMLEAARRALPAANVVAVAQLDDYDSYYYDGLASFDLGLPKAAKTLPALRVEFDDAVGTWLYLTPSHGQILKYESLDRANRWGYYGLHGLDFAFLYDRRPLWDIVVVVLLLAVGVVSATTLLPMMRRLKRHCIRLATRLRRRLAFGGRFVSRLQRQSR
jgi:hypothetical protein